MGGGVRMWSIMRRRRGAGGGCGGVSDEASNEASDEAAMKT
jgi:hypothetical protein